MATSGELRPRRAVLDEAWLAADLDCPLLSAADGRPLARTVKCLLDPLLVRPKLHPDLARPLLDPAAADRLAALLREHRDTLRDADRWYGRLRAARRRLDITLGNPQELYFPRAWELSFQYGEPGDDELTARRVAETLDEVHPSRHDTSAAVATELGRAEVAARARARWAMAWQLDADGDRVAADVVSAAELARQLLGTDTGPVAAAAPSASRVGQWVRSTGGLLARLTRSVVADPLPVRLSARDPVPPPPLLTTERARVLPLDRSVQERVLAQVRRQRTRGEEVSVPETVAEEIERSAAPWGLADPVAHRWLVAGIVLAAGLDPLGSRPDPAAPRLLTTLAARLVREAYVLHVRRLLHDGRAVEAAQQPVVDDLAVFWRPYLTRLWVRLHGLDPDRGAPVAAADGRDLLTGVARSVSLDLRTRIRTALERRP